MNLDLKGALIFVLCVAGLSGALIGAGLFALAGWLL